LVTFTGIVLILMALGVLLLSTQAGSAADIAFERGLSFIYQSEVNVERVSFMPKERSIVIQGVTVENPKPFKSGTAIEVDEILVRVDPVTVLSKQPVVDEIVLKGATFFMRYEVGRGTNLGQLDENLTNAASSDSGAAIPSMLKREYLIEEFRCEEAELNLSANFVPGTDLRLTLFPFDVKGLSGGDPVSATRLCALLIRSVFREALGLRGLVPPAADKFNDELRRMQERDSPAPE